MIVSTLLWRLSVENKQEQNAVEGKERTNVESVVSWARGNLSLEGEKFAWTGPDVITEYAGGAKVSQPGWLSDVRGHDLEYVARETFHELKSHKNHPSGDAWKTHLRDMPSLAPSDVLKTLLDLQSRR